MSNNAQAGGRFRHMVAPGVVKQLSSSSMSVSILYDSKKTFGRSMLIDVPLDADLQYDGAMENLRLRYPIDSRVFVRGIEYQGGALKIETVVPAVFMHGSLGYKDRRWDELLACDHAVVAFANVFSVRCTLMPQRTDKWGRSCYAVRIEPCVMPTNLPMMNKMLDKLPETNSTVKSAPYTASVESPSTSSNNQSSKSSNPRAIGSILPVDRDNLVKFDAHHKSMPVSDKRRSNQSRELHDLLFVIVGDVDTTKKLCMHAYSGLAGHAIVVLSDFEDDLRPVGTWFRGTVRKIIDSALDPIIWQVVEAKITDWPVDQFGEVVAVTDIGPENQCILKCRAIVVNLMSERGGQAEAFNDVLQRLSTGTNQSHWLDKIDHGDPGEMFVADVVVKFSMHLNNNPWRIIEMTRFDPQPDWLMSDELMTSDEWRVERIHTACGFARHPVFGDIFYGETDIQGFRKTGRTLAIGDRLRITFSRQLGDSVKMRSVRVSILPKAIHEPYHEPINSVDGLSVEEQQQLCRMNDKCGEFVRLHSGSGDQGRLTTDDLGSITSSSDESDLSQLPTEPHVFAVPQPLPVGAPVGRGRRQRPPTTMTTTQSFDTSSRHSTNTTRSSRGSAPTNGLSVETQTENDLRERLRLAMMDRPLLMQAVATHAPELFPELINQN